MFVSFANITFGSTRRIMAQARETQWFDSLLPVNELFVWRLIARHPLHFARYYKQGFGLFMWKPYVLDRVLRSVEDGTIVCYADSGLHLNSGGRTRWESMVKELQDSKESIGLFSAGPGYKRRQFVKADAVHAYFPGFWDSDLDSLYASVILIRKSSASQCFISEWRQLCETPSFIDRSPSRTHDEQKWFLGQDADNGLLGLVAAKHEREILVYSDRINLYDQNGKQLKHVLSNNDYRRLDWSALDHVPFQIRRDRRDR